MRVGLLLIAAVTAAARRRLGEKLDLQGLRRLADKGGLGPNMLFKLDGESSFIAETAAQCAEAQQQRRHLRFGFAAPETGEENCTAAASDALAAKVAHAICKSPAAEHIFMIGGAFEERQRAASLDLWYKCPASTSDDRVNASRTSLAALEQFLDNTGAHGGILEIEPDQQLTASYVPNDQYYQCCQRDQLSAINLQDAWNIEKGDPSVTVQVIDSGVQLNHPDLQVNIWQNPGESETCGNGVDDDGNGYVDDCYGWDHRDGDADPDDVDGHGTHCSGTIGAVSDNGVGVAGIAQVQLMTNKFMGPNSDGDTVGYTSDAARAVQYGADNGARVSSNSYGGGGYVSAMIAAITYFNDAGGIVVAAAGNDDSDGTNYYPSCYDGVVSVAALDTTRDCVSFTDPTLLGCDKLPVKASFSNYGNCVEICAEIKISWRFAR